MASPRSAIRRAVSTPARPPTLSPRQPCRQRTVTVTAKSAGYAGNFNVTTAGNYFDENALLFIAITNTTAGQGPNYVSGITITAAGSGYGPDTPDYIWRPRQRRCRGGEHQHRNCAHNVSAGMGSSAGLGYGNRSRHSQREQPGEFEHMAGKHGHGGLLRT